MDKDAICKAEGCYMFAEGAPERTQCEQRCKLSCDRHISYANAPERCVGLLMHYIPGLNESMTFETVSRLSSEPITPRS